VSLWLITVCIVPSTAIEETCIACLENTFCANGLESSCPPNSVSPPQSTLSSACVCNPGYSGNNGFVCVACEQNTFCVGGNTPPQGCPYLYATSPAESSSVLACTCNAGYFGQPGQECRECTEGSYCAGGGSITACPGAIAGIYSVPGATSVEQCVCASGYYLKNVLVGETLVNQCTVCDPGTFKVAPGNEQCTQCEVGLYGIVSGSSDENSCKQCPDFTTSIAGSNTVLNCVCIEGYFSLVNGVECTGCVQGSYKSTKGTGLCTSCVTSTYSITINATHESACLGCPEKNWSPARSDALLDCICIAGYTADTDGVPCNACIAGTYKNFTGVGLCTQCPANTFGDVVAANAISYCTGCPSLTNSVKGTSNVQGCICDPGYSGAHGGPCAPCGIGVWCYGGEIHACTATNPFMTSVPLSSRLQDCTCGPGSVTYNTDSCAACSPGYYCSGGSASEICPNDSTSDAQSSLKEHCICDGGFEGNPGGPCTLCIENTFCSGGEMDTCPLNSFSVSGSSVRESCICRSGYFGLNGGNCTQCPVNSYCLGGETATSCANAYLVSPVASTSSNACICQDGYYGEANGACTICPKGSWCRGGAINPCNVNATTIDVGNFDVSSCLCEKGFTYASLGACKSCDPGEYKTDVGQHECSVCQAGTYSSSIAAISILTCLPCPANTVSVAHTESQLACSCEKGYTGIGGIFCVACIAGTFKEFSGPDLCVNCQSNTYSSVVAATLSATCLPCSAYSNSYAGSQTPTACICQGGYHDVTILPLQAPHHV
jgi:hypothetical protein